MKKFRFLLVVAILAPLSVSYAVEPEVVRTVKSDRLRASGHEGPYRFEDAAALTPAPEGYKPFYISHYGRHGSRYAWNKKTYESISAALDSAASRGVLTPRGQRLYDDYTAFAPVPTADFGQLTPLGWEQQERLGKEMYDNFPEVFPDGGKVFARSSTSQRVIVSMTSFCLSLQKCQPSLDIDCRSLVTDHRVTQCRASVVTPWLEQEREVLSGLESQQDLWERLLPTDELLSLLFTDSSFFADREAQRLFIISLYDLWSGYHNYSDLDFLEDLFTPDQIARMWECRNFADWKSTATQYICDVDQLVQDIEKYADEAIAGGGNAADLRFGHDFVLNGFIRYINLDGRDRTPAFGGDVKLSFQDYDVPMACNIQFVLYRGESGDVLFKVMYNGREATLPQLTAVQGPYYRWSDFKAWAAARRAPVELNTSGFPKADFGGKTAIVAHRGFWNCEDAGFSENSIASLAAAQKAGFWGSEFDVQMTSDGVVIVNHNDNIKGLRIATHTWDELKGFLLPNGERRPTLDEYLAQGKKCPKTMLVLEFKSQPTPEKEDIMVEKVFAALKAHGLYKPNRVAFISFSRHICEKVAAQAPQFVNQYLNGELSPARLAALGINGWDYMDLVVNRRADWVDAAHDLGMTTNVWTVNKEKEMRKFASEGVDAITTNFPLIAREVLGGNEYRK